MVFKLQQFYVGVTSSSQRIQELLRTYFETKNAVFNGEQKIESIICEGGIGKSVPRDHPLASLMMPNSDPQDRFSFLTYQRIQDRVFPM